MKFSCSVEIEASRERVIKLFEMVEYYPKWQDGFVCMEHTEGDPGKPGSKSIIRYKAGKRVIELLETIEENNLPDSFKGLYEAKEMVNTNQCRFTETNGKTVYESEIEYLRFNGLVPKLMALLMPGMFKKQVLKWMNQFKEFVETNPDIAV
jgi:hypothetical protein